MPDYNDEWKETDKILQPNKSYTGGFPESTGRPLVSYEERVLTPEDHTLKTFEPIMNGKVDYFINNPNQHLTRDVNDPNLKNVPVTYEHTTESGQKLDIPVFSGSTTNINPLNDPIKQEILDTSLETYHDKTRDGKLSPLQPFTRSDPQIAHKSIMFTYNRTKLPVADVEWRKGFRHLFFTRPECYVMCCDNGIRLCSQAASDEEFSSTYSRLPHVVQMLAPFYITGSFEDELGTSNGLLTNWHYLLSNRVDGFNSTGTQMTVVDNVAKSYGGFSINPAGFISSKVGGTFDVTFNETKNLECYESLRLWMLYMDKLHKGIFAPSYDGYKYENNFERPGKVVGANKILHPYDRAIDYAATLFDVITNESDTKILYWCKYYGIFPISATPNLSNASNSPLTGLKTTAQFRYMYKLENVNHSLLEFNYNAGIVGKTGKLTKQAEASQPFLVSDNVNNQYLGAAGMWTGSPYIVMGPDVQMNLINDGFLTVPYLRFANLNNTQINKEMNRNIVNTTTTPDLSPISL